MSFKFCHPRLQCIIDLKNNELIIGTSDTKTPFLGEADLPVHARLNRSLTEDEEQRQISEALLKSKKGVNRSKNNNSGNESSIGWKWAKLDD